MIWFKYISKIYFYLYKYHMKHKKILTWLAMLAGASTLAIISVVHAANLSSNLTRCAVNSGAINISYGECRSLAYLYNETNGDGWNASGWWFSSTDVTTWKGGDGTNTGNAITISGWHVITLTLQQNALNGNIYTWFSGLPYLSWLYLLYNNVQNVNFSWLSSLKSFTIGINAGFSGDLTPVSGLKYLNVYYNYLTSERLMALMAPLNKIEHLMAWSNLLTGALDFSPWPTLKVLELNQSLVTSLNLTNNTGLTALTLNFNNLTYLDLSHNPLLGYITAEYGLLTGIALNNPVATEIYLWYNNISSIDLSNNTGLLAIRLTDNQLSSIDISHNSELQDLQIQNNNLTYIGLSGSSSLLSLNAEGNQLTGIDLSGAPVINYLNLSAQEWSGLTSLDISNNTSLWQVLASGNTINTLVTAPAGSYGGLVVFDFSNNPLSNVSDSNALSLLSSHPQYTSVWNFTGNAGDTFLRIYWERPDDYGYSGDLYKYNLALWGNMSGSINITNLSTTGYLATGLLNDITYTPTICAVYDTTGADVSMCKTITLTTQEAICSPGKTLSTGSGLPECIPCEIGTFNDTTWWACQYAPTGSFIDRSGATWATLCDPGYFAAGTWSFGCTAASPGYFVPFYGSQEEMECPANTFSDYPASSSCTPCPSGYTSSTGSMVCIQTSVPSGGGWGGGLNSFIRNPLSSLTTTLTTPKKTEIKNTDTTNNNTDPSVDDAYSFWLSYGLTTLSKDKARLYDWLNRFELAKMASAFLKNVLWKEPVENPLCNITQFADYDTFDSEMQTYVKKACDYGLMGWKGDKKSILNKFNPFESVSREQFATTLYRALFPQSNEQLSSLLQALNKAGIIHNISTPEMSELRWYTLLMFQRAAAYGSNK